MALDFLKRNKTEQKEGSEEARAQQTSGDKQSPEAVSVGGNGQAAQAAQGTDTGSIIEPEYQKILEIGNEKPDVDDPVDAIIAQDRSVLDVIAPKKIETDFDHIVINDVYFRTIFASGYPRFVHAGWLEQIINFNSSLDISFFIYPIDLKGMLDDLRHKIAEMEAELATDIERGKIVDPFTTAKLEDAQALQDELVKGSEHIFEFAFYITIKAANLEHLNQITKLVEATLSSLPVTTKHATLDMDDAFSTSLPLAVDTLSITRNMDTTALATTFPFTSTELSGEKGVLYGINPQNDSFIIFDRFSLENSNMTIFATSGAGKSISYNDPVLYRDQEGKMYMEKTGVVIERLMKNNYVQKIDDELEGVVNPRIEIFAFDEELVGNWSEVQVAARKKSPATVYKITTRSGREINITPDHCLVTLQDGKIVATKGNEVQKGNYVPLPRSIQSDDIKEQEIDVEQILKRSGIKYLKKNQGRVGNRIFTKKTSLPERIKHSEALFQLLGLFTAEGMIKHNRALISTASNEVLRIAKKYYQELELSYSLIKKGNKTTGIYVSAEVFCQLLKHLGVAGKAQEKRVPPLVFSASKKLVANYLRAYFEGDGGVDGHEISATTKSKELASDLSYLLLRFGVIVRLSKTKKAATNTNAKEKKTYYKIRISGQDNIRKFINSIGFLSKSKNSRAAMLIAKPNTNIDTIPELSGIFKEIYDVLYRSSQIPSPKYFSEVKNGIFKPSSTQLFKIIAEIENRIKQIEELEMDGLSTLNSLPSVHEIVKAGSDKSKNKKLWNELDKSWWSMRRGTPPKLTNTLKAAAITHGQDYSNSDVAGAVYRTYKTTGESLRLFDYSLWSAIVNANQNPTYDKVVKAIEHINKKYSVKKAGLKRIKKSLRWLKTLAASDLFWDEIVDIKKTKAVNKYVYDFQVNNEVFLAGHGGMFVHNSYMVKLESLRYLMLGTEIIIIDPENEYRTLTEAVGGQYIEFSFSSDSKINPFDLSQVRIEGENQLGLKMLSLLSLFKLIMGDISAQQEALLDRAINEAYRAKGITQDPETQGKEAPLMEDLYKSLVGLETDPALDLAARIEKYVKGSFVGIFDKHTNIDIDNPFTVFGIKEMQDALRPVAMFIILDFIWTRIKHDLKPRILVVDEAWHMMRYEDSAQFMFSVVKRARKYFLGLTTITQDVEDFLTQEIGRSVVTNSALRVLLKQSPAAIDRVSEVFYLSQGERQLLLGANIGEGIFFAGANHAPIHIVASPEEHQLITTNPRELLEQREAGEPVK